jgi:hypothetical protein
VNFEGSSPQKPLSTAIHDTGKRLHPQMNLSVATKGGTVSKRLVAKIAGMGSFSCVGPDVDCKGRPLDERSVTGGERALERSFSSMNTIMTIEVRFTAE